MKLLIGLFVLALYVSTAYASCDDNTIDHVSNNGSIIVMLDGTVWKSLDPATSSTWLTGEDVLVCNDDKIINSDDDGEEVDAIQLQ